MLRQLTEWRYQGNQAQGEIASAHFHRKPKLAGSRENYWQGNPGMRNTWVPWCQMLLLPDSSLRNLAHNAYLPPPTPLPVSHSGAVTARSPRGPAGCSELPWNNCCAQEAPPEARPGKGSAHAPAAKLKPFRSQSRLGRVVGCW